jgi:hypothetical protein
MEEHRVVSVYGIPAMSEEEKEKHKQKCFNYIKAKIEAERLNPISDYYGSRDLQLLKEIALSDCDYFQRRDLVALLLDYNDED